MKILIQKESKKYIIIYLFIEHNISLLKKIKESNMTLFILGKKILALCWFGRG